MLEKTVNDYCAKNLANLRCNSHKKVPPMTNIRDYFVSRNYLNKTKFCHLMSDVSSVHGLVTLFNNSAESLLL